MYNALYNIILNANTLFAGVQSLCALYYINMSYTRISRTWLGTI